MNEELQGAYRKIIQVLVRYGQLDGNEARRRLDESKLMEFDDDAGREMFLHESPYYWGMALLHGKSNPHWYHDPALWPPPEDYYNISPEK